MKLKNLDDFYVHYYSQTIIKRIRIVVKVAKQMKTALRNLLPETAVHKCSTK